MKREYEDDFQDWAVPRVLVYTVFGLVILGLLVLASASSVRGQYIANDPSFFLKRQLAWLVLGLIAAWCSFHFDYRHWRSLAIPMAVITIVLLLLVVFLGPKIGGSRRWFHVAGFGVQPSELAKFASVVFAAYWASRMPLRVNRLKDGLLVPAGVLAFMVLLMMLEPDVGTSLLVGMVGWAVLLVSGCHVGYLLLGGLAGVGAIGAYVRLNPVRWERIQAWLRPEDYPRVAYHFLEARIAFALGGADFRPWSSMEKHFYLPEAHTDFIFAILGEEFGIWGTASALILFAAFFVCGILISLRVRDMFGRLLAFGITTTITLQALINIAVVTGALPTKGLPLPFFSYGGSSLVMTLFQIGVLLNIGRQAGSDNRRHERSIGDRFNRT